MKKSVLYLFALLLSMAAMTARAESVTFNVCSWDDVNKQVVTTSTTHDCTVIEGQNDDWLGLGEPGKEMWYAVKGADVSRKVLNIFGTVHLVLTDNSFLKCTHIKLEALNNAVLHIHSQSDGDKQGKLQVYNSELFLKHYRQPVWPGAAAIGGGEGKEMGSLYVHGGDIDALCPYPYFDQKDSFRGMAGIGGGFRAGIGGNDEIVIYGGKVKATGAPEGAGIGSSAQANQGGPITIYGGNVEAYGRKKAAAIGGGSGEFTKGDGGTVKIYGGKVLAKCNDTGFGGAGIGGGYRGAAGNVYIYGGEVEAIGGGYGAGIGGHGFHGRGSCTISGGTVYAVGGNLSSYGFGDVMYTTPAIGGGHKGPGSNVIITGGTVKVAHIHGTYPAPLIGGGEGKDDGSLQIANGLKLSSSTANIKDGLPTDLTLLEDASQRVAACVEKEHTTYIVIEPCDHQGSFIYKPIDIYDHAFICKACGYNRRELHNHEGGKDCVCGKKYDAAMDFWTMTLHITTDGLAYADGENDGVIKGQEYRLPTPQPISGLIFMGWLPATTAPEGIEMKGEEFLQLVDGGQTVTPEADTHYYARYRYAYTEDWTWNEDCSSASVTISNAILNSSQTLTATVTENIDDHVPATADQQGERYYFATASYTPTEGITYNFASQQTLYYNSIVDVALSREADNVATLEKHMDWLVNVTINDFTLKKDNKVHPISLPFDLASLTGTPLEGAIIYEQAGTKLENHEFTIEFQKVDAIKAGVPYFYRFAEAGTDVANPVFQNVIIKKTDGTKAEIKVVYPLPTGDLDAVELWGTFGKIDVPDQYRDQFFTMDGDAINTEATTIGAFECYFYISNLYDENGNPKVRSVILAFESGDAYRFTKELWNDSNIALVDNADNSAAIAAAATNGKVYNVTLSGRTLIKDGKWNTLCLPFDVTVGSGQMKDATAMTLNGESSGFVASTGVLTLNFDNVTSGNTIAAGTPFIVKWTGTDVSNPVFSGVTIANATAGSVLSTDKNVRFLGTYNPTVIYSATHDNLFLGDANTLYWPDTEGYTLGACRAYFHVDINGDANAVRQFVLNFGDSETTGILSTTNLTNYTNSDAWYDLSGRRLSSKPSAKGLYIHGGNKVVIK